MRGIGRACAAAWGTGRYEGHGPRPEHPDSYSFGTPLPSRRGAEGRNHLQSPPGGTIFSPLRAATRSLAQRGGLGGSGGRASRHCPPPLRPGAGRRGSTRADAEGGQGRPGGGRKGGRDGAALRRSGAGLQCGRWRRLLVPTAAWRRPREWRRSRRYGRQSPSRSRSRARRSWRRAARSTASCGSRSASSRAGSASTVRGAGAGSGGKLLGPNFFLPFFFSRQPKLPSPRCSLPPPPRRAPGAPGSPRPRLPLRRGAGCSGAGIRVPGFVCPESQDVPGMRCPAGLSTPGSN